MNSLLEPINTLLDIYNTENWLHSSSNTEKNAPSFQVDYSLNNMDLALQKGDYLSLAHSGGYKCSSCQKVIKKIYSGYCYVCLMKKASADMCILNPYQCHFLKGTCREPEWGLSFCYQPHYVYLAYTDKFKVGITRKNQILTRWVDQGATMASPICMVTSRHQAGTIEKALTEILADKSHWQKMLHAGNYRPSEEDFLEKHTSVEKWLKELLIKKPEVLVTLPSEASNLRNDIVIFDNPAVVKINYPLPENIPKIKSVSLEKEKRIDGEVTGIKGQYIFFGERVLNMRNHEGYIVVLESY